MADGSATLPKQSKRKAKAGQPYDGAPITNATKEGPAFGKDESGKAIKPPPNYDYEAIRRQISRRLASAKEKRIDFEDQWDEISRMFKPSRLPIKGDKRRKGQRFNKHLYDSTGVKASHITRAGLMSGVSSPVVAWVQLEVANKDVMKNSAVKAWLDAVQLRLLAVLANSNFYSAFASLYEELADYGTGVVLIDEDDEDLIRCYPLKTGSYYLWLDHKNRPCTLMREFCLNTAGLVEWFGLENCSLIVQDEYRLGNLDAEHWVRHVIEPNYTRAEGYEDNQNMPYRDIYYDIGSPEDEVLRYKGYRSKPFVAGRWDVDEDDIYGYSPAMDALPFVKQLQHQQKQKGIGIAKMVSPPMVADPSMKNEPMMVMANGVTFRGATPGNAGSKGFEPAYQVNLRLDYLREDIDDVRAQVMSMMYADLFLMISQLDDVRTATEIVERKQEKLMQLGPMLERLQTDVLDPCIDRILEILFAVPGFMPPPPPEIAGMAILPDYISILFAAQKAAETGNYERLLQIIGNMAQPFPTVLDKLNSDAFIDRYANMININNEVINSNAQANKIRADREAAAQNSERAAQLQNLAVGAKTLSETDVGGGRNALQQVTGL